MAGYCYILLRKEHFKVHYGPNVHVQTPVREIDFDQLVVRIFACSFLILTEHRII